MGKFDRERQLRNKWKKRQEKRQAGGGSPVEPLGRVLKSLQEHLRIPMPKTWPGGCDSTLTRPDLVKSDLAEFAFKQSPGREKGQQLEEALCGGLLGFLPDIDHWSMEEFLWHGIPGDSWHPIEEFLEFAGGRFPPPAREQLRLWKQAQIGLFEIGTVADDRVTLLEWDGVARTSRGTPLQAISLNIGGVNIYSAHRGKVQLTYLAPWVLEDQLYCAMGYGAMLDKKNASMLLPFLGLQHPEVAGRTLPWKVSRAAADEYLRAWKNREWYHWFKERMEFPFQAFVSMPPEGHLEVNEVCSLIPVSPKQAYQLGIYFEVKLSINQPMVAGGTAITPVEIGSPQRLALAEYHAYRDRAGPPPGTRGRPSFSIIE